VCARHFAQVELLGLFGSPRYLALVAEEHQTLARVLRRDRLRLRRMIPRRVRQRAYDRWLTRARLRNDPRAAAITPDDFHLDASSIHNALDLVAVCRA
jgi:hypothetical protein